ncbi:MAG TPA: hypothetical protein VEY10_06800 [Flavisolibacter sp.]|jgi:hypothetical protein|nr:hypothetical protein [Flavisolibacter sp.]
MKKTLATLVIACTALVTFAAPPVSEKVLKVFTELFPSVQDAKWYTFDTYYQVYFDKDDIKCRIKYDFDGKIISTTRYYGEKTVCPFLKAKLAQKFSGKKIFGVTEITSEDEMIYEFVLEDDKSWLKVKSDATGQMQVADKFNKATE